MTEVQLCGGKMDRAIVPQGTPYSRGRIALRCALCGEFAFASSNLAGIIRQGLLDCSRVVGPQDPTSRGPFVSGGEDQ